ncbi:MAG: hypothetical protein KDB02_01695 [Acidimicrobiales bacterium]|nr:hypothetical protein [Acidimicrobiales bacterium]
MGLDVNRWLKYAKAKLDSAVSSGSRRIDELEAERERERADKPWLSSPDDDSTVPTLDQVRARIEWEEQRQGIGESDQPRGGVPDRPTAASHDPEPESSSSDGRADEGDPDPGGGPSASGSSSTADPAHTEGHTGGRAEGTGSAAPRSPQEQEQDVEREMARLELEERQRASADRLAEIRRELGVDPPGEDGS